jgi:hypothetical protein
MQALAPQSTQLPVSPDGGELHSAATNFPRKLRAVPRWLVWRSETRDGKPTKVPYRARAVAATPRQNRRQSGRRL